MANAIYARMPTTVFSVMSGLAREHGAINLGQGFPDDPGPEAVRRAAAEAVLNGYNQYPPTTGLPELRQAVARHYGRTQGLDLDWASEVDDHLRRDRGHRLRPPGPDRAGGRGHPVRALV